MHSTSGMTALVPAAAAFAVVVDTAAGADVTTGTVAAALVADGAGVVEPGVTRAEVCGVVVASFPDGASSPSEMSPMIPMSTNAAATNAAIKTPRRIFGGGDGSGGGANAADRSPARNA
ncbi:hypothetical protein ACIBED_11685 [Rhodococcus coprophilus]|uniref:hypothetical protein n=1 Tax=Rhodococcus coprophilus TaxID=38310 RepID=UPI0037A4E457